MSYLPPSDFSAVPTTTRWIEAVGYCDVRKLNVSSSLTSPFVQPAVGSTVTASVGTSTAFVVGDTVSVSGALSTYRGGVYYVYGKPTSTSLTLLLVEAGTVQPGSSVATNADVRSVSPILITPTNRGQLVVTDLYVDSLVSPGFGDTTRPTVSIGWNRGGTPFSEFYSAQQFTFASTRSSGQMASSVGATFTQPTVGNIVLVRLAAPAVYSIGTWGFPVGSTVRILRAGVYEVAGTITTTTTAAFVQPATSGVLSVANTADFAVGDFVYISTPTVEGAAAYSITAKTATTLSITRNSFGSSFLAGVGTGLTIPVGSIVTHAQAFLLRLKRTPELAPGLTSTVGSSVIRYWPDRATVTAPFLVRGVGDSQVVVDDNRAFVVGTTAWITYGPTSSAGFYAINGKTGFSQLEADVTTVQNYLVGSTAPAGANVYTRRQAGQVLPLRGTGTTRLSVDPGSVIAAYVSVAGNATSADIVAIHLRGYFVS